MPPALKAAVPRKAPLQERSRRRLEAILDAAAVEFEGVGFEAATMEAIAARASTSIGSVYAFFPNKRSLFEALAERCLGRSRAAFDALTSEATLTQPWDALVDLAVDGFAAFQTDPGFRAVWRNIELYGVYAKADRELHRGIVARTEAIVARKAPRLPPARRKLVATMVVNAISALLFLASRHAPAVSVKMIEETKRMVKAYLAPYARAGRGRGAPRG